MLEANAKLLGKTVLISKITENVRGWKKGSYHNFPTYVTSNKIVSIITNLQQKKYIYYYQQWNNYKKNQKNKLIAVYWF